jgi:hypothetical protein
MSSLFENCLQNVQHTTALESHDKCSKCGKECSGRNASGNLKQHEKKYRGPKKLKFCQYCAKQFIFNCHVIRHEKGCRDRPG